MLLIVSLIPLKHVGDLSDSVYCALYKCEMSCLHYLLSARCRLFLCACLDVLWFVFMLLMSMSLAKTDELIKILFGGRLTWACLRNDVSDVGAHWCHLANTMVWTKCIQKLMAASFSFHVDIQIESPKPFSVFCWQKFFLKSIIVVCCFCCFHDHI